MFPKMLCFQGFNRDMTGICSQKQTVTFDSKRVDEEEKKKKKENEEGRRRLGEGDDEDDSNTSGGGAQTGDGAEEHESA